MFGVVAANLWPDILCQNNLRDVSEFRRNPSNVLCTAPESDQLLIWTQTVCSVSIKDIADLKYFLPIIQQ